MRRKFLLSFLCLACIISFAQTAYKLHEKVKVKWGGSWWDAEIIEVKNDQYKIHYDNYGSNWDEWVKTDRIQSKGGTVAAEKENKQASASDGKYAVGDKVEAWSNGVWYPASISAIGTANYKGYYYVHFTGFSDASNQWLNTSSVRKAQAKATITNVSPRDGKYRILSYGNPNNPIYLGYFILNGSNYSYYNAGDRLIGSGSFTYDRTSQTLKWNSGPFKSNQWSGTFEVSREGKTHTIRLQSGTIGTNSTDAR